MSELTRRFSESNIFNRTRYAYRFVSTSLWMMLTTYVCWITQVIFLPFPVVRARYKSRWFRITTSGMLFFMNVKVRITGAVPAKPFFLVANHLSYVDILVLAGLTGAVFVSKKEVRRWPGIGWVAYVYNSIFLDRENKQDLSRVTALIDQSMQRTRAVVVFPEGTSSDGQSVLAFYSPLFEWPAQHTYPVHTVSFSYHSHDPHLPAREAMCWWGDMAFIPHFKNLSLLRRPEVHIHFAKQTVSADQRKILAKHAQQSVEQHFEKSQ